MVEILTTMFFVFAVIGTIPVYLEATKEFDQEPVDQRWLWREARLKDVDGNQLILFYAGKNRLNPPWRIESER